MLANELAIFRAAEIALSLEVIDVGPRVDPNDLVARAGHSRRRLVNWRLGNGRGSEKHEYQSKGSQAAHCRLPCARTYRHTWHAIFPVPRPRGCYHRGVSRDNQGGCRIASFRHAPEQAGRCLTRMLLSPRHFVNRRPVGLGLRLHRFRVRVEAWGCRRRPGANWAPGCITGRGHRRPRLYRPANLSCHHWALNIPGVWGQSPQAFARFEANQALIAADRRACVPTSHRRQRRGARRRLW